jgi:hypothetical protein
VTFTAADGRPWRDLAGAVENNRAFRPEEIARLRRRIAALATRGICGEGAPHRFKRKLAGDRAEEIGTFELAEVPHLARATLTVMVDYQRRAERLDRSTVMVDGETASGVRFAVAVHLDGNPMGAGACGHAMAHCHVGPGLDADPKIRVPFPFAGPVEALDWVLSQLVPDWEPAPWV